jgi:hypothetical protein
MAKKIEPSKSDKDSVATKDSISKKAEPKVEPKKIEPKKVDTATLIYGDEKEKNVLPFPQSDLQTQTKNIVNEYDINVNRLPQNIVDTLNDFIQIFSEFVSNPNQFNLIGAIMDKDLVSLNLLKSWVEDKKDSLLSLKENNKLTEQSKEMPQHLQEVLNTAKNETTPQINNNDGFSPRQPVSTYQHNIATPPPQQNNNLLGIFPNGENKTIHYEMLTKAYPQIIANDTAQQNWMGQVPLQNEVVIDKDKMFVDYVISIGSLIQNTFQVIHWGYIPLDALNNLINNCDKLYKYEIVNNGDNSFVKVTYNDKIINTNNFSLK